MQKRKTYTIFAIIALALTALCADTYAQPSSEQIANAIEDPVHMPDPNLRAAVREALNLRPDAPVTTAFMRRLQRLDAANRGITDLTGLEFAVSLTWLHIPSNPITELTPIAGLTTLEELFIQVTPISDISPLANLTALTGLYLQRNAITDIKPLANFSQLKKLRLHSNQITDVSPLANLTELEWLEVKDNRIVDVSPLVNLTALTKLLLGNNDITDVTPLENLTNLEYLDTQNNLIFDANSPVVDIPDPNLRAAIRETLKLPDGVLVNRAFMRQLTRLAAANSQITDLTGLEFAINLTWLNISINSFSDITPIGHLTNLSTLKAADCEIINIAPLARLSKLQRLNLEYNDIHDINALAALTQLEYLEVHGNRISDVRPLAGLTRLEHLAIHQNQIVDHSPLDDLPLTHYFYDQTCDLPPVPLQPQLENRTFPSLFAAWGGPGWIRTLNRPELSDIENLATHDLWFSVPRFETYFRETSDTIQMVTPYGPSQAIENRDAFLAHNPNMVFLVQLPFRAEPPHEFPPDWPYWLRDASGNLVDAGEGDAFINFTLPGFQDRMVAQAVAVSKCGLFDGIMIDWWNDNSPLLVTRNPRTEYVGYETEIEAKINILERIRAETRPNFLIIGNTNRRKIPKTGKYLNGSFMETLVPSEAPANHLDALLAEIESSLFWLETNLREPHINSLEGWSVPTEPPDSPTNLRWMRTFTTLSLTHSDGYVLFQTGGGHHHYWYDFWGADLGRPVGPKRQLYQETEGLYIREFTNGWAVYNHSGAPQVTRCRRRCRVSPAVG